MVFQDQPHLLRSRNMFKRSRVSTPWVNISRFILEIPAVISNVMDILTSHIMPLATRLQWMDSQHIVCMHVIVFGSRYVFIKKEFSRILFIYSLPGHMKDKTVNFVPSGYFSSLLKFVYSRRRCIVGLGLLRNLPSGYLCIWLTRSDLQNIQFSTFQLVGL